jgi:hypothetical protein
VPTIAPRIQENFRKRVSRVGWAPMPTSSSQTRQTICSRKRWARGAHPTICPFYRWPMAPWLGNAVGRIHEESSAVDGIRRWWIALRTPTLRFSEPHIIRPKGNGGLASASFAQSVAKRAPTRETAQFGRVHTPCPPLPFNMREPKRWARGALPINCAKPI